VRPWRKRGSVGSMEAAKFGAGLGSLGGWSWIFGGGERKSWKREEEEAKENEMNFFFIVLFFIYFKK
jgi:hypothetical protein